jgi:hypothetical protein
MRKVEYVLHGMPEERYEGRSLWVGFAAFPEPLREGEERYSSYYIHVSITPYSELIHKEFPDHRTPQ